MPPPLQDSTAPGYGAEFPPQTFGNEEWCTSEHAVVIAGGGPTGMMLAAELTLAGTDVLIVESDGPASSSKARAPEVCTPAPSKCWISAVSLIASSPRGKRCRC